jgi:hypothetical protein
VAASGQRLGELCAVVEEAAMPRRLENRYPHTAQERMGAGLAPRPLGSDDMCDAPADIGW